MKATTPGHVSVDFAFAETAMLALQANVSPTVTWRGDDITWIEMKWFRFSNRPIRAWASREHTGWAFYIFDGDTVIKRWERNAERFGSFMGKTVSIPNDRSSGQPSAILLAAEMKVLLQPLLKAQARS
jgi:hypothetical protein